MRPPRTDGCPGSKRTSGDENKHEDTKAKGSVALVEGEQMPLRAQAQLAACRRNRHRPLKPQDSVPYEELRWGPWAPALTCPPLADSKKQLEPKQLSGQTCLIFLRVRTPTK